MIDSHAHLYELSVDEYNETLQRAYSAGVSRLVNVSVHEHSSEIIISQTSEGFNQPEVFCAVGICPPEIDTASQEWLEVIRNYAGHDKVVAIGEIGIDGVNTSYPPMEKQLPFYRKQLMLAKELDIPAIIHCRGVENEALDHCVELGVKKALFHCFTGNLEQVVAIVNAGYIVSFSGIVTFKNSDFDTILSAVPAEQLLLETDSPYLAPVPHRGKKNEPAFVSGVYEYAAAVRGVPVRTLIASCNMVFNTLFDL